MASLFSISIDYDSNELQRNIRRFPDKLDNALSTVFDANAGYGTAWMKANAPWHDDTGAARASLLVTANNHRGHHELLLAHGVTYGIWLETANNRKDEILQSAQRHLGNKIMDDLSKAFRAAK